MADVYVVPDDKMPRYGEEVPRKNWQENLQDILSSIQSHRAKTPVYMPFPAGTKTLQARATESQIASQTLRDALTKRQLEAELTGIDPETGQPTWQRQYQMMALANRLSGGGGGYTPSQRIDDLFKVWQITGKAPTGLENLGVEPGTPFANTREQDLAEDRYVFIKRLTAPQGTTVTLRYNGELMTFPAQTREEALQDIEEKPGSLMTITLPNCGP